jgi:beta-lactamase class D
MKNPASSLVLLIAVFFSSCTVNNAKIDNTLKKYFDSAHVDGCFAMMDNITGQVTVYNLKEDTQRITPGSSFEIVSTLIGLETGKILDENAVIKWDGIKRAENNWNQDLTLEEAFKAAAIPYFQQLAVSIGEDTLKYWIDSLHYGNMNISGPIDTFWLNSTLKISPDEQLGLMEALYFDKLPFQKRSQGIVRDIMLRENNNLYKYSYHLGWGLDEENNKIGWQEGWIEENRHVYFFVTMIKSGNQNLDIVPVISKITRNILSNLEFFKGEK